MAEDIARSSLSIADLERHHGIAADTYCGLTADDMSRAIVAYHGGPREPGAPVGYWPIGSPETRLARLREEFGPEADIERILLLEQFFGARVSRALNLDWMLPDAEFDRAVADGLRRSFPELSDDARTVIRRATPATCRISSPTRRCATAASAAPSSKPSTPRPPHAAPRASTG